MRVASTLRYTTAAAFLVLAACGKDSTGPSVVDPGAGTPVEFNGTLAGSAITGDISITIAGSAASTRAVGGGIEFDLSGSRAVVAVSGCLYLGSTTCVAITGTYNTTSKALSFSTTSPALTFTGTYSNGKVEGTFSGAGGTGVFVVHSGTVQVFCGTFTGDVDGVWNLVRTGNTVYGVAVDLSGTSSLQLTGSVSGSSISLTYTGGTATGTISGTSMSGTWTTLIGDAGTWTGNTSGCRS